jgi:signal transduction histidine kinase
MIASALVLRRVIQTAVPAAVLLASVGELASRHSIYGVDSIVAGSAFAIAGLIAWSLRPANHVGLLMMAVGAALLVSGVATDSVASDYADYSGVVQILPGWVSGLWEVLLIHLLLTFPEGRPGSTTNRVLIGALYIFFAVGFFEAPGLTVFAVYPVFLFVAGLLIVRRWWLGGRARRRSLTPVLWSLLPIGLAFNTEGLLQKVDIYVLPVPSELQRALLDVAPLLATALPAGFLIGLLRSGLDMTTVGSLVVKLSGGLLPEQLQPALAEALHDPSLEIVYWVPSLGSFADLQGSQVQLPGPDDARASSIIRDASEPVAALVYDASLLLEPQLVETATAAVRMALENASLQVQLRAQLEEVRQSRARLAEAAQEERQRLERDLHDGAQQQLVTLLLSLQRTKTEAGRHSDAATSAMLDSNIAALKQALSELRELARGIHPTILTEAGLMPALRSLAERCPIPVEVKGDAGDARLPAPVEATCYFVAAEAITNAVKHSHAQRICVALERAPGLVRLDVSDDGDGGADMSRGTGLRGLSDRVAAVGGRFQVRGDGARGTHVRSEIPCA